MKPEIKRLTRTDFKEVVKEQQFKRLDRSQSHQWFEKLMVKFPKGQFCSVNNESIESVGFSVIISLNDLKKIKSHPFNFEMLAHQSDGETLFEVALLIFGKQEKRLARYHREALKSLCQEMNLRSVMLIAPLTNYNRYADLLSVRDYLNRVQGKEIYDPLLSYQLKGFHVRRMLKNNVKSKTIYVLMEWNNIYFEPTD